MDQIFVHVRYKRTGVERKNVTIKAYNLIQKAYDFIGYVDAEGNPVEGPDKVTKSAGKALEKKSQSAGRVGRPTKEQIAAKRAEMEAMNEASREKFKKEAEEKAKQNA